MAEQVTHESSMEELLQSFQASNVHNDKSKKLHNACDDDKTSLICLPLNTQICILQFVDISHKYYVCRCVCRYWYHLMSWHEHIPCKQMQFLFPISSKYILSSPFINDINRKNHAMILSSLGLGIYFKDSFHLMINQQKNKKSKNKIQWRHKTKGRTMQLKEIKAMGKFVSVNQNICLIDLSGCALSDYFVQLLSYGLRQNESIKDLMLSNNKITSKGCKYIGYCLQSNQSLNTLWMRSNDIGNDGLKHIFHGLHFNDTLKKLSLDGNNVKNKSYKWYQRISNDLNSNGCDDEKNDFLYSMHHRMKMFEVVPIMLNEDEIKTQHYVTSYVRNLKNEKNEFAEFVAKIDGFLMMAHFFVVRSYDECKLEVLSLRENGINEVAVMLVAGSLMNNASLRQLHLSYNCIGDGAVYSIVSLLENYKNKKDVLQRNQALEIYIKAGNECSNDSKIWAETNAKEDVLKNVF